jgi:hypothetical protein
MTPSDHYRTLTRRRPARHARRVSKCTDAWQGSAFIACRGEPNRAGLSRHDCVRGTLRPPTNAGGGQSILVRYGPSMSLELAPSLPTVAELTALASLMEAAGLLLVVEDPDGRASYLMTTDGRRLSRMLSMVDGQEADAVLDALLPRGSRTGLDTFARSIDTSTA